MKKLLLIAICALGAIYASAQNYTALRDTVFGCRYFLFDPSTGQPDYCGSKTGTYSLTWPSKVGMEVRYYVKIPKGFARADMYYTPYYAQSMQMTVTVTDPNTNRIVYQDQIVTQRAMSSSETHVELIAPTNFQTDTWYQIKLTTPDGNKGIRNLSRIIFQHEGTERVVTPTVFMAPSVHNNTWGSTAPNAVHENTYDWVYGEFLYPDEYAYPARYLMCLGGSGYYSGIQVCGTTLYNTALFSAWDNGDTDKNPNLPAYLRSGAVDHNDDVAINRFGSEGTGVQSMMNPAHWKRDHWVQWLLNARPETSFVPLKAKDGSDSIISYSNTILTAWYKMEDDPEWHYISSLRQSGTTHLFGAAGEYSFLECFGDRGGDIYAKGYMKNRFYRSAGSGVWYNRNHMTPGHYNYNDGARECRYDYGHGYAPEYENCFYIEQGGFGQVHDGNMYVPLATNTECVDTIDIDAKYDRINQAFRNNYYRMMAHDIDSLNHLSNGREKVIEIAKNLIDREGQLGSFPVEALADVKALYNEGKPSDLSALENALLELTRNYNEIRYANVTSKIHIGSQRAYLFVSTDDKGMLYAEMVDGQPVLKVGEKTRDDMNANWIVVRSDAYETTSVYNIGLGLYLNFDSPTLLSEEPQNIQAFGRWGKGWYMGKTTTEALVVNEDGTTTTGKYNAAGSQFYLHDNLSFTPSCELVSKIVDATEAPGVFEEYKAKVPGILEIPEGVVGAWTNPEEIDALRELYDEGNVTIDKAQELISLIDNAEKIELKSNQAGAYIITAAGNESAPYLTIDADNYVYTKAATTKPDQVWIAQPKNGGHEFSSQGRALFTLSENVNSNVTTKESGNGVAYFLNPLGGGTYKLGDVQYGPMTVSTTNSPLKSVQTDTETSGWYLTPAKDVKISLNSAGVLSLFLDFDVKMPTDLEAYKLVGFNEDGPLLEQVYDTIPARTPVILHGTGYQACVFEIIPEQNYPTEESIMQGTLLKKTGMKSKTYYTVGTKSGQPTISLTLGTTVNANQCYIPKEVMDELGFTESQYIIDFDNTTAVDDAAAPETKTTTKTYDIQGRETDADAEGIVIKNNQKVLNKN